VRNILTEEKVSLIKQQYLNGKKPIELVNEFGFSSATISLIINERSFKYVEPRINKSATNK
jgi:hypothetical protein